MSLLKPGYKIALPQNMLKNRGTSFCVSNFIMLAQALIIRVRGSLFLYINDSKLIISQLSINELDVSLFEISPYLTHHDKTSLKALFEYFELCMPYYSVLNYLRNYQVLVEI